MRSEVVDARADAEPSFGPNGAGSAEHRARHAIYDLVRTLRIRSKSEEILFRKFVALGVNVDGDPFAGKPRQRQPRVEHPVALEGSPSERTEIRVSAKKPRLRVRGSK